MGFLNLCGIHVLTRNNAFDIVLKNELRYINTKDAHGVLQVDGKQEGPIKGSLPLRSR